MESRLLGDEELKSIIMEHYPCFDDEDDAHVLDLEKAISKAQDTETASKMIYPEMLEKALEGQAVITAEAVRKEIGKQLRLLQPALPGYRAAQVKKLMEALERGE